MSSHSLQLRVVAVERENPDAITIHLEHPEGKVVPSLAGQFLTLIVPVNGKSERRSYSLCSAPYEAPRLSVMVKRVPNGVVSNYLVDHCAAGTTLEVLEPMGTFRILTDPAASRNLVLIGAGSGITPLIAMAKAVLREEPESRVTLIYGNRSEDSIIYKAQLDALEAEHAGRLVVEHVLSQPKSQAQASGGLFSKLFGKKPAPPAEPAFYRYTGRLNRKMLIQILQDRQLTDFLDTEFYLCGPAGMMEEAREALKILKVSPERIHKESFVLTKQQDAVADGEVSVAADDEPAGDQVVTLIYEGAEYQVTVKPGQTILEAGLVQGVDLPYSCQAGLCTACRGKCLSGKVHLDERDGLSDAEMDEGYVLNCVAHPLTDDVVIEIG